MSTRTIHKLKNYLAEKDREIAALKAELSYWKEIASERVAVNIENDKLREQIAALKEEL